MKPPVFHRLIYDFNLSTVSAWSYLVPVIIALIWFHRLSSVQRVILLLPLSSFCMEVINGSRTIITWVNPEAPTNYPFFHLFAPITFFILSWIYREYVGIKWVLALNVTYLLTAIAGAVWIDGIYQMNATALPLLAVGGMGFVATYFYRLMSTLEVARLDKDPLFWASTGILFYNAGSFLLFTSLQYLVTLATTSSLMGVYSIHSALVLILNTLLAIALWMKPLRTSTPPGSGPGVLIK